MNYLRFRIYMFSASVQRWWTDTLPMKCAWWLPRKVALWAFIRVYSCTGDAPGPDYGNAYDAWEKGAGR